MKPRDDVRSDDMLSEDDGEVDSEDEDDSDEESDESDEEMPMKVESSNNVAEESTTVTPGTDKKAKVTTHSTDGNKGGDHVATLCPAKQAGWTPANKPNQQTKEEYCIPARYAPGKPLSILKKEKPAEKATPAKDMQFNAGKKKFQFIEPSKNVNPRDDESSYDMLSKEDGEVDSEDEYDSDEESDESDEEMSMNFEPSKKQVEESTTGNLGTDEKAQMIPHRTDGNKGGGHVAAPYPAKQAGKTPSDKPNQQTFDSNIALESHTKARHDEYEDVLHVTATFATNGKPLSILKKEKPAETEKNTAAIDKQFNTNTGKNKVQFVELPRHVNPRDDESSDDMLSEEDEVHSEMMNSNVLLVVLRGQPTMKPLSKAFSQFGQVIETKVIYYRDTGRSRGFGFVTFKDE